MVGIQSVCELYTLKFHLVLCERQKQSTVVLAAPVGLQWQFQRVGCHTSIVTVIAQSISDAYQSLHLLASLSTERVSKEAYILVCHKIFSEYFDSCTSV